MPPLILLFAQPFRSLTLPPPGSFASQIVIITGANTGLGLETARHIVSLGASKVILGVRTYAKGVAAKEDIEASSGRTGVVEVWDLDLESFTSVKAFAARAGQLEKLDTAIMNAGLASVQWNLSPEGWERQLQRNFPTSTPHMVLLGSDGHADAKFEERKNDNILATLNDKSIWERTSSDPVERYTVTKLFELYIAEELAALTPRTDGKPSIIVDVVAPGFCKSELLNREPGAPWALKVIQFLTARTLSEGSKTIVDAAVKDSNANGKYLDHQKIARPGYLVSSDEGVKARRKVRGEVIEVLTKIAPEVELIAQGEI